ncbi:MAG: glucose-1-phosphate adenylyltransferase, partial [Ruminococcus sp.]|nr:glucose-1-phosphate adenylyltransferase [Ruminococcus sp.]
YLEEDEIKEGSSHDFGKDVLPAMLAAGERMYAYPYSGYWKDVGTIESLWEANMDLLDPNTTLDLRDIYSRNPMMPPHYLSNEANVQNSLVADGCEVYGNLEFSIIFAGVKIGKGATVNSSIIMPGAVIEDGANVQFAIVAENTVIGKNAKVGATPESVDEKEEWGITVIGANTVIPENGVVKAKEMIDSETEVDSDEE